MADTRPDPTCDNHWSDWRGALHEVFDEHATDWPDRTCVIESGVLERSDREFTYRQIQKASNVLAHFLVDHGVGRGDVGVLYAQRSVETVVAVLGLFKAGAAFSVLDPANPPSRQIVQLDVAKPRVFIASKRSGEVPAEVMGWMKENLALRAEVARFQLADDASLGPEFASFAARSSATPDMVIGPDDTHSIVFTSGTTGRPRGVKGRHFTVTYSHAWWKELLHSSHLDRFSLLSGVAHDTLSRDVYEPLLLGACIVIPSPDDFADLAGWMARYAISFMHGTPAMAQVLLESGKGRTLDSLRVIMLGGEQLYRRDCRALRDLAPDAKIINGYGSTETGRSSCFFLIPSRNDDPHFLEMNLSDETIPAGRGMLNTQMLIIDRETNALCDVGAVGEIYFRGPGLAEGYIVDDKQQSQAADKFIDNWFVDPAKWVDQPSLLVEGSWRQYFSGPRDRLYRSGDLGRYLADGNVMCLGRCDDVINIRGYRVEIGEVDHFAAQHSLVRAHCLVQDAETKALVLYYVPDVPRWRGWYALQEARITTQTSKPSRRLRRRVSATEDMNTEQLIRVFQLLTDDIRNSLIKCLPDHAVPAQYIPMLRLPLTANGKVDRRALPCLGLAAVPAITIN